MAVEQRTIDPSTEGWTTCYEHEIAYPQGDSCWMCVGKEMAAQMHGFFFTNHPDVV